MRQIIDALIVGAVFAIVASPYGAVSGGIDSQHERSSGSLQIGLRINVDSDWISLKGTWASVPVKMTAEATGDRRELTIGAVPNVVGRAYKSAALIRALRTTALCVAKHFLNNELYERRSEGN